MSFPMFGIRSRAWLLVLITTTLSLTACQAAPAAPATGGRSAPPGTITRTELSREVIQVQGVRYNMQIVELVFGPNAETDLHTHPGPSTGYMLSGRVTVSVPGENRTSSYSGDSALLHPWDVPHRFSNPTNESVRMLSFELIPLE